MHHKLSSLQNDVTLISCTRKMVQCMFNIAYGPSQDAILIFVTLNSCSHTSRSYVYYHIPLPTFGSCTHTGFEEIEEKNAIFQCFGFQISKYLWLLCALRYMYSIMECMSNFHELIVFPNTLYSKVRLHAKCIR